MSIIRTITRCTTKARSMCTSFSSARKLELNTEKNLFYKSKQLLHSKFPNQCLPYQVSLPATRWLGTTRSLLRKDGDNDGEGQPRKLLHPGDKAVRKDSKEETDNKKMMIMTPPTVQVFADPNMSQTVRDVSVDIVKIKGQLKFLREEFSDSSFEVLKLAQGRSSIIMALKETRKFCRDNQAAIVSLKSEQKKVDQLIAYISKMIARHENQLNDPKKKENDAIAKKIDDISQRIDQGNSSINNLTTTVHDELQVDVKKALADMKQLRNDVNRLELEVKYRGREISEMKSKTAIDHKQLQQKPPK